VHAAAIARLQIFPVWLNTRTEHLVHIPVVVVSATAGPPIAGARCVLRKPVEWQDLLHVISQHVAL
jgi:hypothetical protein